MYRILVRLASITAFFTLCATPALAEDCALKSLGSLPVTLSDEEGLLVPAGIEGRQLLMRFSPSTNISLLDPDVVTALSLHRSSLRGGWLWAYGVNVKFRVATDMTLGASAGRSFFGAPLEKVSKDPRSAGTLGWDILRMLDMELDLAHGKINLFSQDHCPGKVVYWTQTAPTAAVPILAGNWAMIVPMMLDGEKVSVQIDPSYRRAWADPVMVERRFGQRSAGAAGTPLQPYAFKSLGVDGIAVANPQLYPYTASESGRDARADVYLGMQQLKQLRIYVAVKEKMIYITAANAQ